MEGVEIGGTSEFKAKQILCRCNANCKSEGAMDLAASQGTRLIRTTCFLLYSFFPSEVRKKPGPFIETRKNSFPPPIVTPWR
jgi:hypothetical protein